MPRGGNSLAEIIKTGRGILAYVETLTEKEKYYFVLKLNCSPLYPVDLYLFCSQLCTGAYTSTAL
jgi:hypothetical protein